MSFSIPNIFNSFDNLYCWNSFSNQTFLSGLKHFDFKNCFDFDLNLTFIRFAEVLNIQKPIKVMKSDKWYENNNLFWKQNIPNNAMQWLCVFAEVHLHLLWGRRRHCKLSIIHIVDLELLSDWCCLLLVEFLTPQNNASVQIEEDPGCLFGFLDKFLTWPFDFNHELIPPGDNPQISKAGWYQSFKITNQNTLSFRSCWIEKNDAVPLSFFPSR